ncbi:hypothetical protein GCM10022261_05500 [Brevibacterium daeguense]|uniref:HNH nuclease domain-containing protein n=1 Tax=Brevibacterium daeguense TaxID=909936 RepID=A0ABP8EGC6_9MICO
MFLRRLFTAPESGQLVGMESRRREFSGLLRRMVVLRDGTCRTPFCDAAIKHVDHATPHRDGGSTSWHNASGLCARCNYAKENPGWQHHATPAQLEVTTPTGHTYTGRTGSLIPGSTCDSEEFSSGATAKAQAPPGSDSPPGTDGSAGTDGPPGPLPWTSLPEPHGSEPHGSDPDESALECLLTDYLAA